MIGKKLREAGPLRTIDAHGGSAIKNRSAGNWNGVLARVLTRQHVRAVYQPIFDLATGLAAGYEALARPASVADDGSVEEFFRSAATEGVTRDLEWLCRRAALDGARGLAEGPFISLNLNPEALHGTEADAESLAEQLEDAGREPSTVVVEVVRPAWLTDVQRLVASLAPYRALGVRVAVAVGPTDEQPMSRCATPPDFVKLTRPTVSAISLPTVIGFAQRTAALAEAGGPIPIAEGIESEAIALGVAATGIRLGQGYHLGRPAAMDREGHLRAEPVPQAGVG